MLVKLLNAFGKDKMFGINLFEFFDQFWKKQDWPVEDGKDGFDTFRGETMRCIREAVEAFPSELAHLKNVQFAEIASYMTRERFHAKSRNKDLGKLIRSFPIIIGNKCKAGEVLCGRKALDYSCVERKEWQMDVSSIFTVNDMYIYIILTIVFSNDV